MYQKFLEKLSAARHDRGLGLTIYALLRDILFLTLIGLGILLTAESILPGFATSRINLSKPIALAATIIFLLISLGKHLDINHSPANNKKTRILSAFALLWIFALTINALVSFPWWASIIILVLTILILALLWKTFLKK